MKTAMEENGDVVINKMKTSQKITFGFGNLAANLLITTASGFITYYYTDVVGISVAVVGVLLMFARWFDGFTDLIMGAIVDKTKSKHGKARPWLLWMSIPYAVALVLLFSSPEIGQTGKIIYAFVTYAFAGGIVYTAITVPYNSMIGTMTQNQEDRGHLSVSRTCFGFIGAMFVNFMTLKVVNFFGGGKIGWMAMAASFGVVSILLWLIVFKNSKEVFIQEDMQSENKFSTLEGVKALFKNKYWLIIISVMLITFTSAGLQGINIYYAQYVLKDINKVGIIGIASFLPIAVGSLIMGGLMKKFSNKTLMILGNILMLVGLIIIALNPENFIMVLVGTIIKSIGIAPSAVAGFAMLGDCSDYGEWKTGIRTDGLIFSASTFGEKVGSGLGALILSIVLAVGGYVSQSNVQSESTITAIKVVFIYIPMILTILGTVMISFYKLDSEYPKIIKELDERRKNK